MPAGYAFTKKNINSDALNQDKTWYDRSGKEYKITEMSKFHARGAASKLIDAFGKDCFATPLFAALIKQSQ